MGHLRPRQGREPAGGRAVCGPRPAPRAARPQARLRASPMLDFSATVDHGARKKMMPGFIGAIGKRIASLRFDIPWGKLDYLHDAEDLRLPVLLFHGDDEQKVPGKTSDALAQARPDDG